MGMLHLELLKRRLLRPYKGKIIPFLFLAIRRLHAHGIYLYWDLGGCLKCVLLQFLAPSVLS